MALMGRWRRPQRRGPPKVDEQSRHRDEEILSILYLRDHKELTFGQIARELRVSRNAALGVYRRVNLTPVEDDDCTKPENKHGGMDPLWWRTEE